ncbi:MAG TPA: ATP-binding protein [Rhodoblastus sp.]|nr:ATP-binding protein [Rhodoblastus sp.]
MSQITAEMIERGRGANSRNSTERRRLAYKVREAREKLTTGGAGHGAFEGELLRIYAENRISSAPWALLIALAIGGVSMFWAPVQFVALWTATVWMAVGGAFLASRLFLRQAEITSVRAWRTKIILIEAALGLAWASIVLLLLMFGKGEARVFLLAILLMLGAMTAMATAAIPNAVYAAVTPLCLAIAGVAAGSMNDTPVLATTAFVCGAEIYFVALARRLYETSVSALYAQAEKDGLIAELEQAKSNSDEARRRAEEANLAKSRFLATMSHELRTPLNAILGFSEVMKDELFGAHAVSAYRDYSNDIHSSGRHLLALINEILDLSRVEAGRYELKEDAISLSAIIQDCEHLLMLRAQKRGLAIVDAIETDLPRLWADERAIRQVALNLLTNAIKFTPQGGQITIKVGWTQSGGQYFSVRDTGTGIPEHEIPIVMSSFGRGALAQKNADEGSGLGLPIVKGLVELHGGTFTLRSKVREGTEVIVVFPPERVMNALPRLGVEEDEARAARAPQRTAA